MVSINKVQVKTDLFFEPSVDSKFIFNSINISCYIQTDKRYVHSENLYKHHSVHHKEENNKMKELESSKLSLI